MLGPKLKTVLKVTTIHVYIQIVILNFETKI